MSSQPNDDAQRKLEQRALRNVRGLLDKMEDEERVDRRGTARLAVIFAVVALAFVIALVTWLGKRDESAPASVVIPAPAKTAK